MSAFLLNKLNTHTMPIISFHLKLTSTFDNTEISNSILNRERWYDDDDGSGDDAHSTHRALFVVFFEYRKDVICRWIPLAAHFLTLSLLDMR